MAETRTNQDWLNELKASGALQEAAITDLRDLLLRAALYFFSRNLSDFGGLSRDETLRRAEDCAQDALLAVMDHLQDFRGDSKFSTWAYKFAINISLMTARRERWKGVSLDELVEAGQDSYMASLMPNMPEGAAPEQSSMQGEMRGIIRDVIEHELTDKQRRVLLMMVFNDVPMDEVVHLLGSNRNAVYKMLHDARRKLKSSLQAQGFEVGDAITLFSSSR